MTRIRPLDREEMPEFEDLFIDAEDRGREVPNLLRVLARKPTILKALRELRRVTIAEGRVSKELKNMVAQVSSLSAGCNYCAAHNAGFAIDMGIPPKKKINYGIMKQVNYFVKLKGRPLDLPRMLSKAPMLLLIKTLFN